MKKITHEFVLLIGPPLCFSRSLCASIDQCVAVHVTIFFFFFFLGVVDKKKKNKGIQKGYIQKCCITQKEITVPRF